MLIKRFFDIAENNPTALALEIGNRVWTYKELSNDVRELAYKINYIGENAKRIGLFTFRSKISYTGMLASMLLGITFVPLNKNMPTYKIVSIIEQSKMDVIVVDKQSFQALEDVLGKLSYSPIILAEEDSNLFHDKENIFHEDNVLFDSNVDDTDVAYILFTSGSTGAPKGVQISYGSLNHFINYNQRKYNISLNDRLSQTFDQTFDLSIFDILMALCHGAALCVPQPIELLSPTYFVSTKRITVWFSVPTIVNLAMRKDILAEGSMPTLRLSLFCGEPLTMAAVVAWQKAATNSHIENLYGPTELTIACSSYTYSRSDDFDKNNLLPIGKIYNGLTFKILNENNEIIEEKNIPGELCVTGKQIFNGYLNDDNKTKMALVEKNGEFYYRTGDIVKLLDDENLMYIGRKDQQIKVNGYRIELNEIETFIKKTPEVIDAVVVGWPKINSTYVGLVGFLIAKDRNCEKIIENLRKFVPGYMIPSKIHFLDNMPLNTNGKIDRRALVNNLT